MNPLTLVKRLQNINAKEADLGISEDASWHAKYKDSAYVFVGGLPYDLTEGDLLAVFAQYGEIVDVNLVRDKGTGKSKGFAFVAYEDQRSTILAVDNLNGAQILGRIIRVDHAEKYKKKEEEDEEEEKKKREARGVCYAFQRGECTRGAGCKFSHDEQRAANTGWGHKDNQSSKWGNDKFEGSKKSEEDDDEEEKKKREARGVCYAFQRGECTRGARCKFSHDEQRAANTGRGHEDNRISKWRNDKFEGSKKSEKGFDVSERASHEGFQSARGDEKEKSDGRDGKRSRRYDGKDVGPTSREYYDGSEKKRSSRHNDDDRYIREEKGSRRHNDGDFEPRSVEDSQRRDDKRSRRHDDDGEQGARLKEDRRDGSSRSKRLDDDEFEPRPNGDHDRRGEKRTARNESESYPREDRDKRGVEKRTGQGYNRDPSSHRH